MVDVYEGKVLKGLGLPTAVKRPDDIDYYTLLGVPEAVNDDELVRQAASRQLRRLREFQSNSNTANFANRMEQLIIKAR